MELITIESGLLTGRKIDQVVYQLYDLTEEEIKTVEAN